jgi:hypothetical protein
MSSENPARIRPRLQRISRVWEPRNGWPTANDWPTFCNSAES